MAKQVKMTKEIAAKLRGISVVSNTISYTLEVEGLEAEWHPTFIIKNLTVADTKRIKEVSAKITDEKSDDMNQLMEDITRTHLVGWTNLYDLSTGDEWAYDSTGECCSQEQYDLLPTNIKVKVLTFIYSLSGLF